MDQCQWSVFAAITEEVFHPEHVINMIPAHGNPHGFTSLDTSHVQWYHSMRLGVGSMISPA